MPRKIPRLLWVAVPLAYLIYFHGLGATGLLGPDEPRYAFVARAMAQSGDWITPRLWGTPWFEKPALLYWMEACGFAIGLPPELAARLPVALLAVGFLIFYWWILDREFGCVAAWTATLILGTSGMWVGYSQVGVTDIPLTATYSAGMLLALPWVTRRDTRYLPLASAMFGLAVLAKGLVPIPLAAPLLLGRHVRDWLRWRVVLPFLAISLPWYVLCYLRNGWPFLHEFFVVHHFSRVTSSALQHVQPWWYYIPIFLVALLPWTPLVTLSRQQLFLTAWVLTVLVFFSMAVNKLPGYILPAMPAACVLVGQAIPPAKWRLALCGASVMVFPIAAQLLPPALTAGLSHAPPPRFEPAWLIAILAAPLAFLLESRGRRLAAIAAVAVAAGLGIAWLKSTAAPELDRSVSARTLWQKYEAHRDNVCLGPVKRDWDYGLAFYAGSRLPACEANPKPFQIVPPQP